MLRRSRGYVPASLEPAGRGRAPVLACGAELKSTFCLAKGARAWVGHHIGDLENYETLRSFREGIAHFERLFAVEPRGRRARPASRTTSRPRTRSSARASSCVGVQHHHAHLAACLAEHGERGPGGRRDLRRHRLRARRDGLGRRAAGRRPARLRARRPPVPGAAARRRRRRSASRGGWRAPGWREALGERAADPGRRSRVGRAGALGGGRASWRATGLALARDDQHRAAVRRGRRALRPAHARQLRGPGGGRARGRGRPGTSAAPTRCRCARGRARSARDGRAPSRRDVAAGVAGRRRRGALPQRRSRARRRARCARGARRRAARRPWCSRAACSRTGCCSSAPPALLAADGLRVLVPRAPAAQRRRHLLRPGGGRRGANV